MSKCFADLGGRCKALIKKDCDNCNFYKTQERFELDQEKARERLKKIGRVVDV